MKRIAAIILVLGFLSVACRWFIPASAPDVTPVPVIKTDSVFPAFTAIPTFTAIAPTASAQPPIASAPETGYLLQEERQINGYAIRIWRNPGSDIGFDNIMLIEAAGQPSIRINMVSAINDQTGDDINGDGYPEVIVETYSGGAHCCFGTQVYSLRVAAVLIFQKPETNAGGFFEDLDADGISEFVTYDDSFAYMYCPYAAGVGVKSILAYNPGQDWYIPANPRFSSEYSEDIATHEQRATAAPGEMGEWDGTNICAILPIVLDYFYMGQPTIARSEFDNRYSGNDGDIKWNEVVQVVQSSPLYTP